MKRQQCRGILQSLLDSQNAVDIVSEHHLAGQMCEFPLIVVPEWEYLDPSFRDDLISYVSDGGNLLLIGPKCAQLSRTSYRWRFTDTASVKINGLAYNGWMAGIETLSQKVKLGSNARKFGDIYYDTRNEMSGDSDPAASITLLGKGKIAAVYMNLGDRYLNAPHCACKRLP